MTCQATNKAGAPCAAAPQLNRDWCRVHDPENAAAVREASRQGGLTRQAQRREPRRRKLSPTEASRQSWRTKATNARLRAEEGPRRDPVTAPAWLLAPTPPPAQPPEATAPPPVVERAAPTPPRARPGKFVWMLKRRWEHEDDRDATNRWADGREELW